MNNKEMISRLLKFHDELAEIHDLAKEYASILVDEYSNKAEAVKILVENDTDHIKTANSILEIIDHLKKLFTVVHVLHNAKSCEIKAQNDIAKRFGFDKFLDELRDKNGQQNR